MLTNSTPRIQRLQACGRLTIGSSFVFLRPHPDDESGLGSQPQVISRLNGRLEWPGLTVEAAEVPPLELATLTSHKVLYAEGQEAVHLLAYDPLHPLADMHASLYRDSLWLGDCPLPLDELGTAQLALNDLAVGSYQVLWQGATCSFQVASHGPAPLSIRLHHQSREQDSLQLELRLSGYGSPFEGPVSLELRDPGGRLTQVQGVAQQGRLVALLPLVLEGPMVLKVTSLARPSDTATLWLLDAQRTGRQPTILWQLGRSVAASLLPSPHSHEVHGLYLSDEGPADAPLLLERLPGARVRLTARQALEALLVVVVDPTSAAHHQHRETALGWVETGHCLELELPAPLAVLHLGAFLEGAAWEARAIVPVPASAALRLELPQVVQPGQTTELSLEGEVQAAYVVIKDARLITPATPGSALASRLKAYAQEPSPALSHPPAPPAPSKPAKPPPVPEVVATYPWNDTLGQELLRRGLLTQPQLEFALQSSQAGEASMGACLIALDFLSERDLLETLAAMLDIRLVDLPFRDIDPELPRMIPEHLAQRYKVLPIDQQDNRLTLAMVDPLNRLAIDDMELITGYDIDPVLVRPAAMLAALNHHWGMGTGAVDTSQDFENFDRGEGIGPDQITTPELDPSLHTFFAGLVRLEQGQARVSFQVGSSSSQMVVEVLGLAAGDWTFESLRRDVGHSPPPPEAELFRTGHVPVWLRPAVRAGQFTGQQILGRTSAEGQTGVAEEPADALSSQQFCPKHQQHDYLGAIEEYSRTLSLDPRDLYAWLSRAWAKFSLKDYLGALEDCDRAAQLDYAHFTLAPACYVLRGLIRGELGDWQGALEDFDHRIKFRQKSAKDWPTAADFCRRGLLRSQLGDKLGAFSDFTQALKLDPTYAQARYNLGLAESDLGDKQGAKHDYCLALLEDSSHDPGRLPDSGSVYRNLGLARSWLGDPQRALEAYDRALELNPQDSQAYTLRGEAKSLLGDEAGAIADYELALEVEPACANAYFQRGLTRRCLGDEEGAGHDFNRVRHINPFYALDYLRRGNTKRSLGFTGSARYLSGVSHFLDGEEPKLKADALAEAMADYDRAVQIDPGLASAYRNRGLAKMGQLDRQGALEDYGRALRLDGNDDTAYLLRGIARSSLGDWRGAIADYAYALQRNPYRADTYVARALARSEWGDLSGATADCDLALKFNSEHAAAYYHRGTLRSRLLEDPPGAIQDYHTALQIMPDYLAPYDLVARIRRLVEEAEVEPLDLTRLGPKALEFDRLGPPTVSPGRQAPSYIQWGLASSDLGHCGSAYRNRGAARELVGDVEGAIQDYDLALELNPNDAHAHLARALLQAEDVPAILHCNRALELKPDWVEAYCQRARLLEKIGDYRGSLQDCSRALELDPNCAAAYYLRGQAQCGLNEQVKELPKVFHGMAFMMSQMGRTGYEDLRDCSRAIELDPKRALFYRYRAGARHAVGDLPGAIEDYTRLIELNPKSYLGYLLRGQVRETLGDQEGARRDSSLSHAAGQGIYFGNSRRRGGFFQDALDDYDSAIKSAPNYAPVYYYRGIARAWLGHRLGALADYDLLLQLDPNHADGYHNRADLRRSQGDHHGAVEDYTRSLQLKPDQPSVLNSRAAAKIEQGDVLGAIQDYNLLLQFHPYDAGALFHRGRARIDQGDLLSALADLDLAVQLNPDQVDAYVHRARVRSDMGDETGALDDFQRALEFLSVDDLAQRAAWTVPLAALWRERSCQKAAPTTFPAG